MATGSAIIDFGAFPGANEASIDFADATIAADSKVEAYIMADDTTIDHTASDHRYSGLWMALTAAPIAGVGGTLYARSEQKMQGKWALRYVWA